MRRYMNKDELALLLEERHGARVFVWDVELGAFEGFWYDGDLIQIPTPGTQNRGSDDRT